MMRQVCLMSLIVLSGLWTGCTRPSLNSQQKSFLLEIPANPGHSSAPAGGVLKIRHCRAVAPFDSTYFVYRTQSGQYQQDFYKMFLTPPNEQINEHLRVWLEQSRIFASVLPASSAAKSQYVLEPQLSALYTDLSDPTGSKTIIRLHAVLLKADRNYQDSLILLEKTYEHLSPLQNNTSQDVIVNYNLCLEQILTQLQSDMIGALKKSGSE